MNACSKWKMIHPPFAFSTHGRLADMVPDKWNMSISMASTTRCHHGTITARLFCSKKVATRLLKVPVRVLKVATRLLKRQVIPARPSYRFLILLDGPDHLAVSKSGRRRVWGRGCTSPLKRRVASRAP